MDATVLVVDDNAVNRRILRAILEGCGCQVIEASNGASALEHVHSRPPDLVLLDILMPGIDGLEVCSTLKSDSKTRDIPVIVVSSLAEGADRVRGLEAGAEDYVSKPFDPREVAVRVATHLRIRNLTRSLSERQKRLDEDLRAAAEIQRSLLPRSKGPLPGLRLSWLFEPCAAIGGDVFNAVPLTEKTCALYIVDVSGHGVPSALVTVSVSQSLAPSGGIALKPGTCTPESPGAVLARLDQEYPHERFESFFTIVYLTLDTSSGEVRYSSAGHPAPFLLKKGRPPRPLKEGGTIIGLGDGFGFEEGSDHDEFLVSWSPLGAEAA